MALSKKYAIVDEIPLRCSFSLSAYLTNEGEIGVGGGVVGVGAEAKSRFRNERRKENEAVRKGKKENWNRLLRAL
jgi:hypothetical protein